MFVFGSSYTACIAISIIELRQPFNLLYRELVLPSASTLSNFWWTDYTLTVDAIEDYLRSRHTVSLALDGSTSMNKLAITWVIAYYMDRCSALGQVPLSFDKVNHLFCSCFEIYSRIIGQGSTCWSNATHTCQWASSTFEVYCPLCTWNDQRLLLATVLDCCVGSGSGLVQNYQYIGCPGPK